MSTAGPQSLEMPGGGGYPGEGGWCTAAEGRGEEQTIKSTMTNDLDKSCEVCFRAGLPFRVLNPGDRGGAGESSYWWPHALSEGRPWQG